MKGGRELRVQIKTSGYFRFNSFNNTNSLFYFNMYFLKCPPVSMDLIYIVFNFWNSS